MAIFEKEFNYEVIGSMWQAFFNPKTTSKLEHLDSLFEKAKPVPVVEYNYTNLLTLSEDDSIKYKPITTKQASHFALSIYLRLFMSQKRSGDIEALCEDLSQQGYEFDHHWI
jgi:hypothetical protein